MSMAAKAMQAQMAGVNVSGQNLANVNTPGYSRQTVRIAASPDVASALGPQGDGAAATGIQQVVSALLNTQVQNQQSTSGYWTGQQTALQTAQNALDEFLNGGASTSSTASTVVSSSSTGIATQLSSLFTAFQALATSPNSASARQAVLSQAQALSGAFNAVNSQLGSLRSSLNTSLDTGVSAANGLLAQVATLNQQITAAEFGGGTASALRDTRQQALESLAQLTNITTSTDTTGAVSVTIGGQSLVSGNQQLDSLQTYDAGGGQMLVRTATGGADLTLTGGSLQGTIDARDNTLATLQTGVNSIASALITQVNAIHSTGYNPAGGSGALFFTGTDAGSMAVNPALTNNPNLIQASGSASASGDNAAALQLAQLASSTQAALNSQTFGKAYTQSVAGLGNDLKNANTQVTNQAAVAQMLNTQRSSVSGVNMDEEMTSLLAYQRAYEASAKLVATVNVMLGDVLAMKA